MNRKANLLMGAFVADAASLGLHWLYDPDRIKEVAAEHDSSAFVAPDKAHFDDAKGYFAHGNRRNGQSTQYGEVLRLALRHVVTNARFDTDRFATAFAAHFGPGGTYQGYIDRPTRGALENIAASKPVTGIDDDQLPAIATLPAILAAYHGTAELLDIAKAARHVTNVNRVADDYALAFTDLLSRLLADVPMRDALQGMVDAAPEAVRDSLSDGLNTPQTDSVAYAAVHGRACHLPMAGPLIVQILRDATDYRDAVERNIRAGGDSAGRALIIGAAMGCVNGLATPNGVPLEWLLRVEDAIGFWRDCLTLAEI